MFYREDPVCGRQHPAFPQAPGAARREAVSTAIGSGGRERARGRPGGP
jgi:hypothetical protein